MTQRVQQAIALLPMSLQDLNTFLQSQLDENPFLMEAPPREYIHTSNSSIEYISKTLADSPSSIDDVIRQLHIHITDESDRMVGTWILHNLDEHGFFRLSTEEAAEHMGATPQHVEAILALIHTFEPVGVGASGIAHCWRLQLEERQQLTPELEKFLQCVEKLKSQSLTQVARTLGYSMNLCQNMLQLLRTLPPYPFRSYVEGNAHILVPDVLTTQNEQGHWCAQLNMDALPELLVNHMYLNEIRAQANKQEDKAFIRERVGHARWLIQALQERARNLLSVGEHLVEMQYSYWLYGTQALVPMTLKDIAKKTGLHVSTISRLTTNKYIQTPHGTIPLKYFFSRSLTSLVSQSYDNEGTSSKTIQYQLRRFIHGEEPQSPLSDDHLVTLFEKQGILVARRTINKYRQLLNIPSSTERKRLYTLNPQSRF